MRAELFSLRLPKLISEATILSLLLFANFATAEQGDGSFRFEYQYVKTGDFDSSIGPLDIGETDAHVFMFSGSYQLSERWSVAASLPWIKKRHQGALPHNPALELTEYPEADQSLIDDGNFHSDWEDLYINVSYAAYMGERWTISPIIAVGVPTNDYPFYGHAAVGRNIWHLPVGTAFSFKPYFSDISFSGDIAYVFSEKSLGVNIDHWLINLDLSYYLTRGFAPRVFVSIKHSNQGLSFPDDFDVTALNDINWYFHDRTIKHNFVNAGIGFDWFLDEKYLLSASAFTMVDPDQVNTIDYGLSLGFTRYFSGR